MSLESRPSHDHDRTARREKEPPSSLVIVYAGQSHRRKSFIQYCFPSSPIFDSPGGEEPEIEDVIEIMNGKLDYVLKQVDLPQQNQGKNWKIALIAADTRTSTLTFNDDAQTYLESRGKPKRSLDVKRMFEEMHEASELSGTAPHYAVRSASGVHVKAQKTEDRLVSDHLSTIELHPEAVKRFSTSEGFQQYLAEISDFYSSSLYANEENHSPITIFDISGGLSLPVLVKMKAVVSIDGTRFIEPYFHTAFRNALYNAAVGISPEILSRIHPRAHEAIKHWPWLTQVVDYSLDNQQ